MLMDKNHALLKDRVSGWLQIGRVAPSLDVNDTKHFSQILDFFVYQWL